MYEMKYCTKCKCNEVVKGSLSGPSTLSLSGIPDWLSDYFTYTCKNCGYTEIVKNIDEKKSKFRGSALGG